MQASGGLYKCNVSSGNNASRCGVNTCKGEGINNFKMAYLVSNLGLNIIGIASNAIVVFVYKKNKQLRTKSNLIIATIGFASILLAVSEIAFSVSHLVARERYPTMHWVTVQNCIEAIISYYSIQAMALMSVQRRTIVSQIRRPNNHTNLFHIKIILLAIGCITAATSIPLINMLSTVWLNITFYFSCNFLDKGRDYYYLHIAFLGVFSFVPLCVTIGSYSYINNRIQRKSGTLRKKIKRESLKRGKLKRADMQSSLGITTILIFLIIFCLPREIMALLLAAQRRPISQRWLYVAGMLMSNVFQQFLSLVHACTSMRYRLKLRQSLTRPEVSIQTTESANYNNWYTCNTIPRMQSRQLDSQQPCGFRRNSISITNTLAIVNSRKSSSIQILHSVCNLSANLKGSSSFRYVVEPEATISGLNEASGRTLEETKSEKFNAHCSKSKLGTLKRRFTDSELEIKIKTFYAAGTAHTLMNRHLNSHNIAS